jgi:hypothetical protein
MSDFTPGPWHYDDQLYIWGPKGEMIFTMNDGSDGPPDMIGTVRGFGAGLPQDANAALIAAAPDLLAACQMFVEWDEAEKRAGEHDPAEFVARIERVTTAFNAAREAIAKATTPTPGPRAGTDNPNTSE